MTSKKSAGTRTSKCRVSKPHCRNEFWIVCRLDHHLSCLTISLTFFSLTDLDSFVSRGDVQSVERLRFRVHNGGRSPPPERLPSSLGRDTITPISPAPTNTMSTSTYTRPAASLSHFHQQSRVSVPNRHSIKFRESPFYQVREALSPMRELIGIRALSIIRCRMRLTLDPRDAPQPPLSS